jgi:tetratricopeptide (TPR) repeat protein
MEAYDKAQPILERLARRNPAVAQFARDLASNHNNIGNLQLKTGHPQRAAESQGKALMIRQRLVRENPDNPDFASELGGSLHNIANIDLAQQKFGEAKQRLLDAIVLQKKALAANPRNPTYRKALQGHYANLLNAARGLGDDALAREAQRGLDEQAATDPQRLVLDSDIIAVMDGKAAKDNDHRLALAQHAYDTKRYALAARLFSEAMEADPKLGDDRQTQHRYNGACSAALAGCSQGKDDPAPVEAAKVKLRKQALDWLKAELAVWFKLVESGPPQAKAFIVQILNHWKNDADLVGIRDEKELAKLPDSERDAFTRLWAEVDALLAKARGQ